VGAVPSARLVDPLCLSPRVAQPQTARLRPGPLRVSAGARSEARTGRRPLRRNHRRPAFRLCVRIECALPHFDLRRRLRRRRQDRTPQFRPLPAPTAAELEGVTRAFARKARCALHRTGLLDDQTLADTANAQPELAGLIAEPVRFPKGRVVDPRLARPPSVGHCGVDGFNLRAVVAIRATDSAGREGLCRYLFRPPVSDERLTRLDDGRVELALKMRWRDGSIALRFTPEYHGVLAPGARGRSEMVPRPRAIADEVRGRGSTAHDSRTRCGRYLVWAELLRRVFEIDVLTCPTCGGRLRLVSVILDGLSARRYLTGASRMPEPAARPPPPQRDGRAAGA
jgi:hypothetical protein